MKQSKESNEKRSKASKRFWASPEGQKKRKELSKEFSGENNPAKRPEARKKISKTKKGRPGWSKGLTKETDPRVAKHAQYLRTIKHTQALEHRKKNSEGKKRNWKDPKFVAKQMKAICGVQNKKEKFLEKMLNKFFSNQWRYVGGGEVVIGNKCPDFISTDNRKKIIELFGDYWHSEEITGVSIYQQEQERINHFAQYGYQTLIIWEHELNDMSGIINKIQEFCSSE